MSRGPENVICVLENLWREEAVQFHGPWELVWSALEESQSSPRRLVAWEAFTVKYVLSLVTFLSPKC